MSTRKSYTDITTSALLGAAVGDAMGVPVEFLSRKEVRDIHLTEMVGCDTELPFESRWGDIIPAGAWSDDTSMIVAAMSSIVERNGKIDYCDIMQNFVDWWEHGKYCSIGHPFGLGGTVARALNRFMRGISPELSGPDDMFANGNGALMRILPFSLYCIYGNLTNESAVELINTASGLTHGHDISKMGCVIFTMFLKALLTAPDVASAWEVARRFDYSRHYPASACSAYSLLLSEDFYTVDDSAIRESGYVVDTIMVAVLSMLHGHDYESSILRAINMGYDTDTNAAVTGALAGAFYGSIPGRWLDKLQRRDMLIALASEFAHACRLTFNFSSDIIEEKQEEE